MPVFSSDGSSKESKVDCCPVTRLFVRKQKKKLCATSSSTVEIHIEDCTMLYLVAGF